MLSKTRTILIFVSLVSFIYILRDGDNSPVGFLARQASRILEERALTDKLCSGITMYESTSGEKSRSDKISSALRKMRSGNPLMDFIEGSDDSSQFSKEYAVPLVAYAAPWIVFFVIGIVGFVGCAINCCCMHYSCCGCIKACQKPTTTKYRTCFKNSSLVLMTLLVGTSIAGLIFSQDVRVGGQQTVCALGILVDNLLEGVEGGNWLGLNPILDNMTFLFTNNYITQNAVLMLPTYPLATTDKTTLFATYNAATSSVTSMNNNNQGKTATRPDQSIASTYTPDYIAQITTITGNIQTEIDTKYNTVTDGIDDITQGIAKINLVTYMTAVIQPYIMYQLDNAAGSAKNLSMTMDDNGGTAKSAAKAIGGGLIGVFSVELISSVAAIAAIALVACGHKFFNKVIYGSCFCLSILMILGWILSAVLFPTGILLIEGCEVSERFQTDEVFYNKVFDKFLNNPNYTTVRNILHNCLFEDGDVLTEIDIRKYFGGHQQLFDGLEATYTLTEVNGVTIDNSVIIPEQQTLVGNYKTGLISDADATTTDLKKLNQYTNSGTYTCTSIDDTWTLNSGLCKNMGTIFQSSSADDFNINKPTCIGFDAWGSSHNINNRYTTTTYPTSCGSIDGSAASTTLDNFVNKFVQSRSDVNTIFGNVQSSLNSVSTANANFMTQVKSATSHIDASSGPRKTIAPVYAKLGDHKTGILPNGNCKWVRASLGTFQDVMCERFITGVFQSTIVIIIASFLALFGTLTLFCLAKRFLIKEGAKGQYNHVTLNSPSKYTVN